MSVKTPTSSLTAGQLLANRLWYRTKAGLGWLSRGRITEESTARSSPITKIPPEIAEIILSHLIYDTPTLLACSLTCYSWYIIIVSHLHHFLASDIGKYLEDKKRSWPRPLQESYKLGLLPLVKELRIRLSFRDGFGPNQLDGRTLRYFSALTNLQELGIDNLQVSSFMPDIQRYFGHLSPTLRFLALKKPKGSCREILYFIGLFPNLQNLKLQDDFSVSEQESATDATLIPPSTPPLQGWLTLICCTKETLVKHMITFFGGLRFRHMDLFGVPFVRLPLDACAETLETLRLYSTDSYVTRLRDSPGHFNLSQHRSLRTLETTARSITFSMDGSTSEQRILKVSSFLKAILSSVTSPRRLDVVVIYRDVVPNYEPSGQDCKQGCPCRRHCWMSKQEMNGRFFRRHLRVFREIHNVRDFRLVLCVDALACVMDQAIKQMEEIVERERARGGFDFLSCEPLLVYERRTLQTRPMDDNVRSGRGFREISYAAMFM